MLHLILGEAGTGKTARIYDRINLSDSEIIYVLVPEQYHFETEKEMYRLLGDEKFGKINIVSFTSVSEKILAECTSDRKPALSDVSKQILMYCAVNEIKPELTFFNKAADKPSFASVMLKIADNLKYSGITDKKLTEIIGLPQFPQGLKGKIKDIALIYSVYNAMIEKTHTDPSDDIFKAAGIAMEDAYFGGAEIYVDSFDRFGGSEYLMLCAMINWADKVNITLLYSENEHLHNINIFKGMTELKNKLVKTAEEYGIKTKEEYLTKKFRPKNPDVLHASENVFGYRCSNKDMEGNGVIVTAATDSYSEADYICAEIRNLIMHNNYRYNEICILGRNIEEYRSALEIAFEKYDIPYFYDAPEKISRKPLVNLVIYALEAADTLSTECILNYIKTGFVRKHTENGTKPLSMSDIDKLDNFVYTWSIDNDTWKQPFEGEKNTAVENLRKDIIPPLLKLKETLAKENGAEITEAIANHLINILQTDKTIIRLCNTADVGMPGLKLDKKLSADYFALWEAVLEVLESLHTCLDGVSISGKNYIGLLKNIFSTKTLAKPPQTLDAVLTGSLDRTRVNNVKAVFIIGANDGVIPLAEKPTDVFTPFEAEVLINLEILSELSRTDKYCYEKLIAYKAVSLPDEMLYITYPMHNIKGEGTPPSVIIKDCIKSLTGLTIKNADLLPDLFYCKTEKSSKQRLARIYRNNSIAKVSIKEALANNDNGFIKALDKAMSLRDKYVHKIKPSNAKRLFSAVKLSATSINDMSLCKFMYFGKYGLNVKEPVRRDYSAIQVGNVIHYCLQHEMEKYNNDFDKYLALTKENFDDDIDLLLNEYLNTELMGSFSKTRRFYYLYGKLKTIICDILIHFQNEFKVTNFRPAYYEMEIGNNANAVKPIRLNIQGFGDVEVIGKIDRVDFLKNGKDTFARIIDYKSGNIDFRLPPLYYGLNLQMMLYLYIICKNNGYIPAGILYFPATEGVCGLSDGVSDDVVAGEWQKQHKMSGVMVGHNAVETDLAGGEKGYIKDSYMNTDEGKIKHICISEEQMKKLNELMLETIQTKTADIFSGNINAEPVIDKITPCDYCIFTDICGNTAQNPKINVVGSNIAEVLKNTKKEWSQQ